MPQAGSSSSEVLGAAVGNSAGYAAVGGADLN
jgi:hypothetical protein